jgi:hypothetical protein
MRIPWTRRVPLLVPILAVAAGVQMLAIGLGLIPWNSDQGIVALMGRHIAIGKDHPIFCYGSFYGGTLEPHLTAIVFATLGMTRFTYRLSLVLFLAVLITLVFRIGRRFLGAREGAVAAAYLTIPPFFFLLKGLTSDGAYVSLAVLGAVIVLAAAGLEDAISTGGPPRKYFALMGAAAGLAWWVHPLSAYFFLAVFVWFLVVRPSVLLRLRDLPVFLGSFLCGSLPWWIANLQNGWRSLKIHELAPLPPRTVALQFLQFIVKAVPALFGGRSFYAAKETFPLSSAAAILIYLSPVAFVVARIVRTGVRQTATTPEVRESRVLLLLLILLVSMQFLVSFSPRIFESDPRFLYPIYAPFSLVLGFTLVRVSRTNRSGAIAAAAALAAFHVLGFARTEPQEQDWQETTGSTKRLIRELESRGLYDVYTGYWTAYRLAFESEERIRPGIFGIEATDRYPEYTAEVDRFAAPAVVLHGSEARDFHAWLARNGSQAKSIGVGPHEIFWELEPPLIEKIRQAHRLPAGD